MLLWFKDGCARTKGPIPQSGWTFPCETSTPMVCQEELLQSTVTKHDPRFMPSLLPQAKLLRGSIALSPKTTQQQSGSRRRCTRFFNSKDIRNQTSEIPSSFPRGTSAINQKLVLWTLEWIYEGLRDTTHWERNPTCEKKEQFFPSFSWLFALKAETVSADKNYKNETRYSSKTEWKCWGPQIDASAWQQLCRVPVTIPARCHSRIRPFCERTLLISELFPCWPQYHHNRWFRKAEISGSHGVKSPWKQGRVFTGTFVMRGRYA